MRENLNKLKISAKNFDIDLNEEKLRKFELFEKFIREYNTHTNLVSTNDINLIYEKHFFDSLSFGKMLNPESKYKIIDIGSGGGFPVIPLAIILEKSIVTAVDSTKKKTDFIELAAKHINLENINVINARAEDLAQKENYREKFDIVTARALGNLAQISELCIPFLALGGKFIAYKATKIKQELEEANNAIKILGGKYTGIFEYNIAADENFARNLVSITKISTTPKDYPRNFSAIKKKHL